MLLHDETDLIRKVQAGNIESFRPLYHHYITSLYRFFLYHVQHREEAEDLTSQTFFKILQSIKSFRFEAKFQTWIFTIARFTLNDHWRSVYKKGKEIPLADYLAQEIPQTEQYEPLIHSEKTVHNILRQLPRQYRKVLRYRFLKNYSIKETAHQLKLTPENVKVLQHRALKKAATIYPLLYAN
ncbi:MAG: sigma-70 family RNA polymerase sigma factor [Candidatus Abawacabacteria bacterium]|nr:sigma-70 family RNA polymerase sigma factor [Candidatus Abawacabacteria bacterium]